MLRIIFITFSISRDISLLNEISNKQIFNARAKTIVIIRLLKYIIYDQMCKTLKEVSMHVKSTTSLPITVDCSFSHDEA